MRSHDGFAVLLGCLGSGCGGRKLTDNAHLPVHLTAGISFGSCRCVDRMDIVHSHCDCLEGKRRTFAKGGIAI